jgi:hypothetical protein
MAKGPFQVELRRKIKTTAGEVFEKSVSSGELVSLAVNKR